MILVHQFVQYYVELSSQIYMHDIPLTTRVVIICGDVSIAYAFYKFLSICFDHIDH